MANLLLLLLVFFGGAKVHAEEIETIDVKKVQSYRGTDRLILKDDLVFKYNNGSLIPFNGVIDGELRTEFGDYWYEYIFNEGLNKYRKRYFKGKVINNYSTIEYRYNGEVFSDEGDDVFLLLVKENNDSIELKEKHENKLVKHGRVLYFNDEEFTGLKHTINSCLIYPTRLNKFPPMDKITSYKDGIIESEERKVYSTVRISNDFLFVNYEDFKEYNSIKNKRDSKLVFKPKYNSVECAGFIVDELFEGEVKDAQCKTEFTVDGNEASFDDYLDPDFNGKEILKYNDHILRVISYNRRMKTQIQEYDYKGNLRYKKSIENAFPIGTKGIEKWLYKNGNVFKEAVFSSDINLDFGFFLPFGALSTTGNVSQSRFISTREEVDSIKLFDQYGSLKIVKDDDGVFFFKDDSVKVEISKSVEDCFLIENYYHIDSSGNKILLESLKTKNKVSSERYYE
ncbi:hypothetical protein [Vibrio owensii]|uniref:hypothetical protein n=1 Tax=Vibrio owensii TaxID=696485 RepID=UPI0038CE0BFE